MRPALPRQAFLLIGVICPTIAASTGAFGQPSPATEQAVGQAVIEEHTQVVKAASVELKEFLVRYNAATDDAMKTALLEEMKGLAQRREGALEALMHTRPQDALELVFSPAERTEFPEVLHPDLEEPIALEGILEVLIEDRFEEGVSLTHYTLVVEEQRYTLHFVGESPALISGSIIRVRGVRAGSSIAVPGEGS